MVRVSRDFIHEFTTKDSECAINSSKCLILGFKFGDLHKGWISRVDGMIISDASAELFKRLKCVRGKKEQKKVIDLFKRERGEVR